MQAVISALGFIVVLLDNLWVGGEYVEAGEVLQVDRAVRNDWIGSKLARDANDEEVEEYRAAELEAAAEAAADAEAAEAAKVADKAEAEAGDDDQGKGAKKAPAK
ncbi:hypothetical protein [Pseudomonas viridiflava]|uniref:hypothetical protein n=1 Tax=Pseudomonas viridiflava TaxID=33069 RepID=UPI00177C560C|nr:hypothetical protein [Pseudomonas viridiflava]